jgi:hypothetical protein
MHQAGAFKKGGISMPATALAQDATKVWESKNASALASYLSDDVVCLGFLPQPLDKAQYIDLMKAVTTAFPDWSFNGHVLNEQPFTEHSQRVLVTTLVTGTHTGDLILPDLPIIPATGTKIALPNRHLEYIVTDNTITTIRADFSPTLLGEVLAHLGMVLPS